MCAYKFVSPNTHAGINPVSLLILILNMCVPAILIPGIELLHGRKVFGICGAQGIWRRDLNRQQLRTGDAFFPKDFVALLP
jgi:hypothetical protein